VTLIRHPHPARSRAMPATRALGLAVSLGLGLGLLAAAPAQAEDDKRAAMTREALRRAQQNAQTLQTQRDALQADKAKLEQDKRQLEARLAQLTGQAGEVASLRHKLDATLSSSQTETQHLKADLDTTREQLQAAQKELAEAQQRGADLQDQLGEQRRITASVSALLQRSVQGLGDAETTNTRLTQLGQQAVQRFQRCEVRSGYVAADAVAGIEEVKVVAVAEQLRRELDALRLAPQP